MKVLLIRLDNILLAGVLFIATLVISHYINIPTAFFAALGFGLGVLIPPVSFYKVEDKSDDKSQTPRS